MAKSKALSAAEKAAKAAAMEGMRADGLLPPRGPKKPKKAAPSGKKNHNEGEQPVPFDARIEQDPNVLAAINENMDLLSPEARAALEAGEPGAVLRAYQEINEAMGEGGSIADDIAPTPEAAPPKQPAANKPVVTSGDKSNLPEGPRPQLADPPPSRKPKRVNQDAAAADPAISEAHRISEIVYDNRDVLSPDTQAALSAGSPGAMGKAYQELVDAGVVPQPSPAGGSSPPRSPWAGGPSPSPAAGGAGAGSPPQGPPRNPWAGGGGSPPGGNPPPPPPGGAPPGSPPPQGGNPWATGAPGRGNQWTTPGRTPPPPPPPPPPRGPFVPTPGHAAKAESLRNQRFRNRAAGAAGVAGALGVTAAVINSGGPETESDLPPFDQELYDSLVANGVDPTEAMARASAGTADSGPETGGFPPVPAGPRGDRPGALHRRTSTTADLAAESRPLPPMPYRTAPGAVDQLGDSAPGVELTRPDEVHAYRYRKPVAQATQEEIDAAGPLYAGGHFLPSQEDKDMAARGMIATFRPDGTQGYSVRGPVGGDLPASAGRAGKLRGDLTGPVRDVRSGRAMPGTQKYDVEDVETPLGTQQAYRPTPDFRAQVDARAMKSRINRLATEGGLSEEERLAELAAFDENPAAYDGLERLRNRGHAARASDLASRKQELKDYRMRRNNPMAMMRNASGPNGQVDDGQAWQNYVLASQMLGTPAGAAPGTVQAANAEQALRIAGQAVTGAMINNQTAPQMALAQQQQEMAWRQAMGQAAAGAWWNGYSMDPQRVAAAGAAAGAPPDFIQRYISGMMPQQPAPQQAGAPRAPRAPQMPGGTNGRGQRSR